MELLHMKISDLLLESDLSFFRFPNHETGWGVRYPGQGIFTPTLYYWHTMRYVTWINKIKQLFYGTITYENIVSHLDFLSFWNIKLGGGVRYPGRGIFTPTLYYWHAMRYVT